MITAPYFCVGLLLAAIVAPLTADAAEFRILPSMIASEEYTDNAYLVPQSAGPVSDWVTRLAPGVQMTYKAPLWDWDAAYTYDYRHHTEHEFRPESDEKVPAAHLASLTRIVPEFLFLDIRDDYSRISLNPTRDYTQESSFVNQTDRNVFSVSPYAQTRLSDRTMLAAGYLYRNTWYKDPRSIDTVEHEAYGDLKQEVSQRMTVRGGVRYTQNDNNAQLFSKVDMSVGQTYEYAEGSSLATTLGYSRFHIEAETKARPREIFWDVSEQHRYSTVTLLFATSRRYIPDPQKILRREDSISAAARRDTERTILTVNGGLSKYFNANTKNHENSTYHMGGSGTYRVTTQTNITGLASFDRFYDAVQQTRTRRHQYGLRLDQAATETLSWALDYRYGQAEDHTVYFNNYRNNRFLAELKKQF